MTRPLNHPGFSLRELIFSIVLIVMLLAVLLPALETARQMSRRTLDEQRQSSIFTGWSIHLDDTEIFPDAPIQPDWRYAGVTFARASDAVALDFSRPLSRYFTDNWRDDQHEAIFHSPLDQGITDPTGLAGTGERTAFRSYGTSYRANIFLLDARRAGIAEDRRPLRVSEVETPPSSLVLFGAPLWYETLESTGLQADWYGVPNSGNMTFLDGSVRFVTIRPGEYDGEVAFAPVPGLIKGR